MQVIHSAQKLNSCSQISDVKRPKHKRTIYLNKDKSRHNRHNGSNTNNYVCCKLMLVTN